MPRIARVAPGSTVFHVALFCVAFLAFAPRLSAQGPPAAKSATSAGPSAKPTDSPALPLSPARGQSNIVSWNAWSRQFIDPPEFRLLRAAGLRADRATVTQGGKTWQIQSPQPRVGLETCWRELETGTFTLTFAWIDAEGKLAGRETSTRVKAPDWQGFHEKPDDWVVAADRNMG